MSSSLGARPIEVLLVEDNAGDIRLLTVMFCVGVAVMLWHLSHLSSTLVESGGLQGTSLYSQSLTELRTFYNSEVVERVKGHGIDITHDYATKRGAIPIPQADAYAHK
jgi:hypothetical protein